MEDVKVAAEVSGSQLYHYFPDKDDLVQAVIEYNADAIVSRNRQALGSANGVEAWRKMVITAAKRTNAKGGCALGSLGGQLAESGPDHLRRGLYNVASATSTAGVLAARRGVVLRQGLRQLAV